MDNRVEVATAPTEEGAQAAARHFASQGAINVRIRAMPTGGFSVTADGPQQAQASAHITKPMTEAEKANFEKDWKAWEARRGDQRQAAHMTGSTDHRASTTMVDE